MRSIRSDSTGNSWTSSPGSLVLVKTANRILSGLPTPLPVPPRWNAADWMIGFRQDAQTANLPAAVQQAHLEVDVG